jgi:hypothetical protein
MRRVYRDEAIVPRLFDTLQMTVWHDRKELSASSSEEDTEGAQQFNLNLAAGSYLRLHFRNHRLGCCR